MKRNLIIALLAASLSPLAQAQTTSPLPAGYAARAEAMTRDSNYTGVIDQLSHLQSFTDEQAQFMLAASKYERGDGDAPQALRDFISRYPASTLTCEAQGMLADYYFFDGSYAEALQAYRQIDVSGLAPDKKRLINYRTGVCLVRVGQTDEAEPIFRSLQAYAAYSEEAKFYLAYIDYCRGDLTKAYSAFASLDSIEAGYYMAQIDFSRGDYDKTVSECLSLLDRNPEREMVPELHRLLGESYLRLGDTRQAYDWLNRYVFKDGVTPNDSAVYALATILYDRAEYGAAAELFQSLTDRRNSLAQSAYLFLGQCAERDGDANTASMAFRQAYLMDFDPKVTESALYNYVAAYTNGGNAPFASSTEMLEDFLSRFPGSKFAPKVEEYLASAYYNDKNYTRALRSISSIQRPSQRVTDAKQKILYHCGIEALTKGDDSQAADYFAQAASLKTTDADLTAEALLWQGDALFRAGSYDRSADVLKTYLDQTRRQPSANRSLGLYDYGYALYEKGSYSQAATQFSAALDAKPALSATLRNDARIRLADCLYYSGRFSEARSHYAQAVTSGGADADYAAYRHAVMSGLVGDNQGKIKELAAFAGKYPSSPWIPAANLEMALSQQALGLRTDAHATYADLIKSYPTTSEARRAALELAISYAEAGNADKAVEAYKDVIKRWPTSQEAYLAHEDLRKKMAEQGRLEEYARFLNAIPNAPSLKPDEMESLTYEAAAQEYGSSGKTAMLEDYVAQYPAARNTPAALLTLANEMIDAGDDARALTYAQRILDSFPHSAQAPNALYISAVASEQNNPAEAEKLYRQLLGSAGSQFTAEALSGLVRTASKPADVIKYADQLLAISDPDSDQGRQTRFFKAKALTESGRSADGEKILAQLAKEDDSTAGARAAVTLGEIYLKANKPEKARLLLEDFTDRGSADQYWLARAYISLADAYNALGKKVAAKEYLRTLRDNYPGSEADIKKMINSRLNSWK